MARYRDSSVETKSVRVREVAESIQYGHTASAISREKGPRFLRITDIQDGNVDWESVPSCDIAAEEVPKYRLSKGDLVFARTGATTGKSFLINECPDAVFASYLIRVRASKDVDPRYLALFFQTSDYWQQIERGKRGIGQPNVNGKVLGEIELPLPNLEKQRRIVAEIEKQFTQLEAGVAALRRAQANLKRHRAAVLKAACEGSLVPTEAELAKSERKSFETGAGLLARILARRKEQFEQTTIGGRTRYKEPAAIEPGPPPATPEGWTLASAEAVCSSVRDGTHDTPAYVQEGVPLITSKNLLSTGLDFENVKLVSREDHLEIGKRSGVERGDILFAMIGTIGNPVVVETDREFSIKNVGLFKANPDFFLSRYLRYWFSSPPFNRWLKPKQRGTTQKFVPLGLLRALVVALPPLPEQTRIVAEVERRLSVVEELGAVVSTNLQRASRLRQSILHRAFSGAI